MELAYQKRLTVATNVQVYFCDPQSPGQRGTNENTNRLLRQYFPKVLPSKLKHDRVTLESTSAEDVGVQTPAAILEAAVASTA